MKSNPGLTCPFAGVKRAYGCKYFLGIKYRIFRFWP